jgi:hypothetical protein
MIGAFVGIRISAAEAAAVLPMIIAAARINFLISKSTFSNPISAGCEFDGSG